MSDAMPDEEVTPNEEVTKVTIDPRRLQGAPDELDAQDELDVPGEVDRETPVGGEVTRVGGPNRQMPPPDLELPSGPPPGSGMSGAQGQLSPPSAPRSEPLPLDEHELPLPPEDGSSPLGDQSDGDQFDDDGVGAEEALPFADTALDLPPDDQGDGDPEPSAEALFESYQGAESVPAAAKSGRRFVLGKKAGLGVAAVALLALVAGSLVAVLRSPGPPAPPPEAVAPAPAPAPKPAPAEAEATPAGPPKTPRAAAFAKAPAQAESDPEQAEPEQAEAEAKKAQAEAEAKKAQAEAEAKKARAEAKQEQAKQRAAEAATDQAPQVPDDLSPRQAMRRAAKARRADQLQAAEALLRATLEKHPRDHHVKEALAETLLAANNPSAALPLARQIVRKRSRRASYRILLGDTWAALGERENAKQAWERALKLDPDNIQARRRLDR